MRITRTQYAVGNILCSGLTTILAKVVQYPTGLLYLLVISIGVSIYLAIGRLQDQDMDKNPWLSVLVLIPFVGLFFLFSKGTQGANKYGEDPRVKKGNS